MEHVSQDSKVYVAAPLFSLAEQTFNYTLVTALRSKLPEVNFILPQEYAREMAGQDDFLDKIFAFCINSIDEASALLCILDGADADSGTCIEVGYAYAKKIPIIGLRTDFRSLEENGLNIMVSRVCHQLLLVNNGESNINSLVSQISDSLTSVLHTSHK